MIKRLTRKTIAEGLYLDAMTAVAVLSGLSMLFLIIRITATGELRYAFLVWNLFLAWLPAFMAWRIVHFATKKLRLTVVVWIIAWILFLPNTFYILSDLIHLETLGGVSKLYDSVMLFSFSVTGFLLGLGSIAIVHVWIRRYLSRRSSWALVIAVIFASSFAIYLGRYLRWNSWDIAMNPLGLLFDVSDRVLNPGAHSRTFSTTFLFFTLILTTYWTIRFVLARIWRRLGSLR